MSSLVTEQSPTTASQPGSKVRDPWFDNIKMSLVTLVVVGHSWTLVPKDGPRTWVYDFLYAWHIPAFVIITGYLSKSFEWTPRRLWHLVTTVAVPYVIFEGAFAAFRLIFDGEHLHHLWLNPHWPMWYLSALFFWRLMTPIFKRLPGRVTIAVLISLVAGLYAGDLLDAARIFGMLPFFVLGLKMHEGHWNLLRSRRARGYAVLVLVTMVVLARFSDQWIDSEWLYYRSRYDALDPDNLRAATIRLVLLLTGVAGSLAFFALVPRVRSVWTDMGRASLEVYLFHGFFVLGAATLGVKEFTVGHQVLGLLLGTLSAVAVACLLAAPPVARKLKILIDPIGTFTRSRSR